MLRVVDEIGQVIGYGIRSKGIDDAALPGELAAAAAGDGLRLAGEPQKGRAVASESGVGVSLVPPGVEGSFAIAWQRPE
jgi:hypothetical protein